ncbi:neurogenic locus notch homolog protein 3-like isoform X2 [Haliotis rufescens]|uniref:neurogenic locus notch homolog protein 3-like isoform X2 n=1 Tax=Haliotis rufescens TaxID=6454 RepID=UPI00201F2556|nr:neurogenic locus notch homolog protein 3-like isoform X2 [Haliotis rufescens]
MIEGAMAEYLVSLLLILMPLLGVDAQTKHFTGGSMSFKFVNTSKPTEYKIQLTIVTGWTLGQGPCGEHCSINDVGRSTVITRNHMLNMNGDVYFGNWSSEAAFPNRSVTYSLITNKVAKRLTGEVAAVNVPLGLEQEKAEVILEVDPLRLYTDIEMHGYYWKDFDYGYTGDTNFHLQVKIDARERSDTGQPNNSPVAMFKPTYKILLNSVTVIKLSTMDKDGDFVQCQLATFITAGGLPIPRNTIINKDCSIEISAYESDHFFDQGWGVIPVKISDFNSKPISLKGDWRPVKPVGTQSLSDIMVQFMIQTLKIIEEPEFVDPTKSRQHVFYVYVGSTLEIPLYAKPYDTAKSEISIFNLRSIPRRSFPIPPLQYDTNRKSDGIKYALVKWRPGIADVGTFVLSALVTDNLGNDGQDRSYNIIVRDLNFTTPDVGTLTRPFFTLFPTDIVIRCLPNSTCSFPIYSTTRRAGGRIQSVKYLTSTLKNTQISSPVKVTKNIQEMFETDVTITSDQVGGQRICFQAYDDQGTTSERKCLGVTMEIDDPCKSDPCTPGACESNGSTFKCICKPGYTGEFCDIDVDECLSNPCQNGATCLTSINYLDFYYCQCVSGFTGSNCETNINDCKPDSCSGAGICIDLVEDVKCQCNKGHSGQHCENPDPLCSSHVCANQGVCVVEQSKAVCRCPLGYGDPLCQTDKKSTGGTPINKDNGHKESPFITPTLLNGGGIQCTVGVPCPVPLYIRQPPSGTIPPVTLGPTSPGLTASVDTPTPDKSTGLQKTLTSHLTVIQTNPGEQSVCVDAGTGVNADRICYLIHTKPPGPAQSKQPALTAAFLEPSLPDGSIVNCYVDKPCHAIFHSKDHPPGNCFLTSGSTSAMPFPVNSKDGECQTDVLFTPPPGGDSHVCLQVSYQGEKRCYKVNVITDMCDPNPCNNEGGCANQPQQSPGYQCVCTEDFTGDICQQTNPCYPNSCQNGGDCVSQVTSHQCLCPVGYIGHDCETALSHTSEAQVSEPTLHNGATLQCHVGVTCSIPVFTRGPGAHETLTPGPTSNGLHVNITQPVASTTAPDLNQGSVQVTPTATGNENVCIQTTSGQPRSDQVTCYHVNVTPPGGDGSGSGSGTTSSTDHFEAPTPTDGSTVPCAAGDDCHLLVYSKPTTGNKCPQVSYGSTEGVETHIFPTKPLTGTCATDVLITPDSKTGDHQICLNSRSRDPPRCFKVDPDASKPCAVTSCGHGVCIVETNHTSTCLCDDVHSGDSCNKEAPCKSSPCQNHGACENDGKNPICHCPIGYTGVNCETGIHVPLHQKPTFTGASINNGGVFNCVKDQTCTIPLSISKGQGPAPVIKVGPHSNGLTVQSPDLPAKDTDTPGRQDLYTSQMHITATEVGEKKLCVKTGSDTTDVDSANADTVCYHLHVTDTGTTTPVLKDSFHDPTPVSGSTIRCSQGKDCHMILHTLPDNGGQCPQVTTDTSTANVFPTRKDTTWTDCITDVSVPAAIAQHPSTVCLKARQGEQPRCYSTKPTPPTDVCSAKGCNKIHGACILEKNDTASCLCDSPFKEPTCDPCQNHGIIEGGTCHCPTGFTGLHCETGEFKICDIK